MVKKIVSFELNPEDEFDRVTEQQIFHSSNMGLFVYNVALGDYAEKIGARITQHNEHMKQMKRQPENILRSDEIEEKMVVSQEDIIKFVFQYLNAEIINRYNINPEDVSR